MAWSFCMLLAALAFWYLSEEPESRVSLSFLRSSSARPTMSETGDLGDFGSRVEGDLGDLGDRGLL